MDVSMVGVSEASLVVIRREEHARLGGGGTTNNLDDGIPGKEF